jgi:hypothetical protein
MMVTERKDGIVKDTMENLGKIQIIKLATEHKNYASLMIFELGFFDQLLCGGGGGSWITV